MRLKELLEGVSVDNGSIPDVGIGGVTCDSRQIRDRDLFVAVKGADKDGSKFIVDAIKNGASAVVSEDDPGDISIPAIRVRDSRMAMAIIADNYFGRPSRMLKVIGITGTNGKTTITYIIESIVTAQGGQAGVIGTINHRLKGRITQSKNTTPGPLMLGSMLADMVREGAGYAIMEVSSHSLDQRRVDGIRFDAAVFTNVTSDHMDYHKTPDRYFAAKKRIFELLKDGGYAILNTDDDKVASLNGGLRCNLITYGIKGSADVRAEDIKLSLDGSDFKVITPQGGFSAKTKLIGMHNVSNILAAVAASISTGIDLESIKRGIRNASLVPGRLEPVDRGQPFKVFVDYAHTEDALFNILSLLREVSRSRITTVFGCGGDRDRTKRPLMGRVACEYSDMVIITSDNPRSEDPERIVADIVQGINKYSNYCVISDRRLAIEKALLQASAGDIVVIAGKGHEDYQIIMDKAYRFDDRQVAGEVLKVIDEDKRAGKGIRRKATVR